MWIQWEVIIDFLLTPTIDENVWIRLVRSLMKWNIWDTLARIRDELEVAVSYNQVITRETDSAAVKDGGC